MYLLSFMYVCNIYLSIHSTTKFQEGQIDGHTVRLMFVLTTKSLFSWLAVISRWGPFWAGDVPDVITLHTCPRFQFWLMTTSEGTYIHWWRQRRHRPSTALVDQLLPTMRKVYLIVSLRETKTLFPIFSRRDVSFFLVEIHILVNPRSNLSSQFPFFFNFFLPRRFSRLVSKNIPGQKSRRTLLGEWGLHPVIRHWSHENF